ncbi:MAG: AbrB/MazE/SpoVT family DNA-binding domain-containing protein [Candidatus Tectomicrobia bacterium]|nr:AbrB/MazE/SpoVT family DNA-binding domain-containing protein [Candidatus Tectomicrobia bacterium]
MQPKKTDIRKVTRGFQITLPISFCERYGVEIGDFVEVVEVGGALRVRPVTFAHQDAQAMLDDTFAEADATRDPSLTVASDDEALAIAQTEIKAHRNASKPRKP